MNAINVYHAEISLFCPNVSPAFHREDGESQTSLVIIQCDSRQHNSDLIACARYRIYDEAVRAKSKNRIQNRDSGVTHVLFMVRLPPQEVKSHFVGFQGDPWISVHIDDLRQTSKVTVIPEQAITAKLSELFIGAIEESNQFTFHPQHRRLHGCIQAAVSSLKDPERDKNKQRLQKLMSLIPKDPEDALGILVMLYRFFVYIYQTVFSMCLNLHWYPIEKAELGIEITPPIDLFAGSNCMKQHVQQHYHFV